MAMLRIGVDTGGTFTDLVWMADGRRRTLKVTSTPADPAQAVILGLERVLAATAGASAPEKGGREVGRSAAPSGETPALALPPGTVVVHGSTVATNALLEGKVALVALVTNAGFEDILAIGRENRTDLYDAGVLPPDPLVPSRWRMGVPGRLGPDGEEILPLDEDAVREAVQEARAEGISRFAVCLLHSYANPAHEEAVGRIVAQEGGQATLSCRILPEYREYERTSTTVVNAALEPVMTGYLERLEAQLPGAKLSVFRSNGGILAARAAGREAVQTLLSGPAAGVLGAWSWGSRCDLGSLITFDMGGTSTDVALIDGEPATTTECVVGGHPVRLPMIDIHTVGAGGGSLARCDAGGALVVGPESAGADPGPACYGRGLQATVTDAQLVLGRLPEDLLLGGDLPLDGDRARAAMKELAAALDCKMERAAAGIIQVANAGMTRAIRVVSLARGHDPRDFALFCFGGAGGLHAADLAESLGMQRVVVPPGSGTFSAYGMMTADVVRDASRSVLRPLVEVDDAQRQDLAQRLVDQLLTEMQAEGFPAEQVKLMRSLDLRYQGQSYELTVPDGADVAESFHAMHQRRYDHRRSVPLEVVTLRIRAVGPVADPGEAVISESRSGPLAAGPQQQAWFHGGWHSAVVYQREDLRPGDQFPGPAIIAAAGSTTVVPPAWECSVDPHLNLHLVPVAGEVE